MGNEQSIGRRIAEARRAAGLTQEAFAISLGYSLSSVRNWEYATNLPRLKALQRIADLTGKPVSWFYEDTDEAAA